MFHEKALNLFLETALERHRIYTKKEAGQEKPWTIDQVFQQFFFCNVFRQYDKCSKWIIENIVPYVNENPEEWPLLIVYRFISTYNTFENIKEAGYTYNLQGIKAVLREKKSKGERLFEGCFIRNPSTSKGLVETYKAPFYLIDDLINYETRAEGVSPGNFVYEIEALEDMVRYLSQFKGCAGFMSYEYACDLEYTKWFNPTDKYTWANKGPGANRGLSLLLTGLPFTKYSQNEWLEYARQLLSLMQQNFNVHFPHEDITMREVEHWLCEFQKYVKYLNYLQGGNKIKHRKYYGV